MRVFLLGPGYYNDQSDHRNAFYRRLALAELLSPHEVEIMELSEVPGDLTEKFYAIAETCEEFIIWLPETAILPTTFGELLLLRSDQSFHGRALWIFAQTHVLDDPGEAFSVQKTEGKIGYLLDLPKYFEVNQFSYDTQDELEDLFRAYARGDLALQ